MESSSRSLFEAVVLLLHIRKIHPLPGRIHRNISVSILQLPFHHERERPRSRASHKPRAQRSHNAMTYPSHPTLPATDPSPRTLASRCSIDPFIPNPSGPMGGRDRREESRLIRTTPSLSRSPTPTFFRADTCSQTRAFSLKTQHFLYSLPAPCEGVLSANQSYILDTELVNQSLSFFSCFLFSFPFCPSYWLLHPVPSTRRCLCKINPLTPPGSAPMSLVYGLPDSPPSSAHSTGGE